MEQTLQEWLTAVEAFARAEIFTWARLTEFAALILVGALALLGGRLLKRGLERHRWGEHRLIRIFQDTLASLAPVLVGIVLLAAAEGAGRAIQHDVTLLATVQKLLLAWFAIALASRLIEERWARSVIIWTAWGLAALAIVGWLEPVTAALDGIGFSIGEVRLTILSVLQGAVALIILLWLSNLMSSAAESRLARFPNITPSTQVLFAKVIRIALIAGAILIALSSIGIDFTALAVFGGALGVGIGLGLQKIVSNFVSGIILLADRSIKPGDVIEVGDSYGRIDRLSARYVSIVTRDGKEYLVPNEDLITQQVINWSFSDRAVRVRLDIGIAYSSDVRQAIAIALEAAAAVPRVLKSPAPKCLLWEFGDNSVNLQLRIWITDPEDGVRNVSSEVLLEVWDRFHEAGIEFPFPQRDVYIKALPKGQDLPESL